MWAVALLCCIAIGFSALCFIGVYQWNQGAGDDPVFLKWFLFLLGCVFFIVGVKPANWKPWRFFFADKEGIHFPSRCPETSNTEWLVVPWAHVGEVKEEIFKGRYKGLSIELLLQDDQINRFFHDIRLTRIYLGYPVREGGYFKVGYINPFESTHEVVDALNYFKNKHKPFGLKQHANPECYE